jgi:hypothetical protein
MGFISVSKCCWLALGIENTEEKHVLGLLQRATENTRVEKELVEDLVAPGLNTERRYLFVIDAAKVLRGDRTSVRQPGRSAGLSDSQTARCERAFAEERPGRLQPKNSRRLRND